jgi:GNAT superfamily N-acetyltransferase
MARIWGLETGEGGTSEQRMTAYFDGQLHPQQALPPRVIYLAEEGDALVGYIAGHLTRRFGCDAELEWLYVIPERRRSGVASGLMPCLVMWFQQQSAARVCVNVARTNTAAIQFYAKHGAAPMKLGWMVWDDIAVALARHLVDSGASANPSIEYRGRRGTTETE